MTDRRRFWLKLAAGLLFAVVVYGGSYVVMVSPAPLPLTNQRVPFVPTYNLPGFVSHAVVDLVLLPAHRIDRRIRPAFWNRPRREAIRYWQSGSGLSPRTRY